MHFFAASNAMRTALHFLLFSIGWRDAVADNRGGLRSQHISLSSPNWLADECLLPLAEAAEYLYLDKSSQSTVWDLVDKARPPALGKRCPSASEVVALIAGCDTGEPLDKCSKADRLLHMSLTTRAHLPAIEAHMQQAKSVMSVCSGQAWVALAPRGDIVCNADELLAALNGTCQLPSCIAHAGDALVGAVESGILYRDTSSGEGIAEEPLSVCAALYGAIGSPEFYAFHDTLYEKAVRGEVRYSIHHLHRATTGQVAHALQGWGIFLDVKNMEYKNYDLDSAMQEEGNGEGKGVQEDDPGPSKDEELSGIMFGILEERRPELKTELRRWRSAVLAREGATEQLEVWSMRNLGLQAVQSVRLAAAGGASALTALEQVSQNFPLTASELSSLEFPKGLRVEASLMRSLWRTGERIGMLYVNGIGVDLASSAVNIFSTLRVLREERAEAAKISAKLSLHPRFALPALLQAGSKLVGAAQWHEVRVELLKGDYAKNGVRWLNNIESDAVYASWPDRLDTLLYPSGQPHRLRRNLYNLVVVLDPLDRSSASTVLWLGHMIMQGIPVRLGLVLTSAEDMAGQDVPASQSSPDAASTRQVAELFSRIYERSGSHTALNFIAAVCQQVARVHEPTTKEFLANIYSQASALDSASLAAAAQQDVDEVLHGGSPAFDSVFQGSASMTALVRERGLPLDSWTLNGKVHLGMEQMKISLMYELMEEQGLLMNMVADGTLGTKTRSVYSKLIKSDKLSFRKRFCPLANQSASSAEYLSLSNNAPLDWLPAGDGPLYPHALVLAVVDANSQGGLALLEAVLSFTLGATDQTVKSAFVFADQGALSTIADRILRLLPGNQALCTLLAVCRARMESIAEDESYHLLVSTAVSASRECGASPTDSEHISTPGDDDRSTLSARLNSLGLPYFESGRASVALYINGRRMPEPLASDVWTHAQVAEAAALQQDLIILLADIVLGANQVASAVNNGIIKIWNACALAGEFHGKPRTVLEDDIAALLSAKNDYAAKNKSVLTEAGDEVSDEILSFIDIPGLDHDQGFVQLVAVLDPLSVAAQRGSTILSTLHTALAAPVKLLLAPSPEYDGSLGLPLNGFYRFVFTGDDGQIPAAVFEDLPRHLILTQRIDAPDLWVVRTESATQDVDNLLCDSEGPCGDAPGAPVTRVSYSLEGLLLSGHCYDITSGMQGAFPPQSLQLQLAPALGTDASPFAVYSDTVVMANLGYFQLQAHPGAWRLLLAPGRGSEIYTFAYPNGSPRSDVSVAINSFAMNSVKIFVVKREGMEGEQLVYNPFEVAASTPAPHAEAPMGGGILGSIASLWASQDDELDTIHVFSLATGHLYERFIKVMMLSVVKRSKGPIKFWLLDNYLSPGLRRSAQIMANTMGFEVEFVTYKWPSWLRGQSEKQRIIWGYKILFLDVLFPLDVKRIIYVDADQVVRADLRELWSMDLQGAPYAFAPFCDSREETLGYQFWRGGFWKSHLQSLPYHISALFVVDLDLFRQASVGDSLRSTYQTLSADPNSLSNLDQDLPNYVQHQVPIYTLPPEWLWCESWCSDESKAAAKTIDLCNNPMRKEPKLDMARRIINGSLFQESWDELDQEVKRIEASGPRSSVLEQLAGASHSTTDEL